MVWDEVFGNHCKQIEASIRAMNGNTTLVWVFIGDTRQILPVIENGADLDIIGATFTSSSRWPDVERCFLKTNLRLRALEAAVTSDTDPIAREAARMQGLYGAAIIELGEGRPSSDAFMMNLRQEKQAATLTHTMALTHTDYFVNTEEGCRDAIEWLHPGGDLSRGDNSLRDRTILAITNERVDFWNSKIQQLNPQPEKELRSHDYFSDVDDPHGHLAKFLTEAALNKYSNTQVPNHILKLKVGDVCLIMRPMKASDLASNSRVLILSIGFKVSSSFRALYHYRQLFTATSKSFAPICR